MALPDAPWQEVARKLIFIALIPYVSQGTNFQLIVTYCFETLFLFCPKPKLQTLYQD